MRPDRLYTLIPESAGGSTSDGLSTVISSIRRVAERLPVLTEAQAAAQELRPIKFETSDSGGVGR